MRGFVRFDELVDVRSFEDRGTHGAREGLFLLFLHDGEGQGLDELPLNMYMIGRCIGGRSGAGGVSSMA